MPRSTIASRRALLFDKALELRDALLPEIAADSTDPPIIFYATKQLGYRAVVDAAPYTGYLDGTSQWEIMIEVADSATGTYKEVARCVPNGTQQRLAMALSGEWVESQVPDGHWVRVRAMKTGMPGPLNYGAFLTC